MLLMLDFITTNDAMMKRMKAEEGEKKKVENGEGCVRAVKEGL